MKGETGDRRRESPEVGRSEHGSSPEGGRPEVGRSELESSLEGVDRRQWETRTGKGRSMEGVRRKGMGAWAVGMG